MLSMVSEPRKSVKALQFILYVLVIYDAHTTTKYFHIPFLKGIFFFLNPMLPLGYWAFSVIK